VVAAWIGGTLPIDGARLRSSRTMEPPETPSPELHPMVSGFSDAQTYDLGRPRYGQAVASALLEMLELSAGDPVLELGAGTGQLSQALVESGLELTAVEPLEQTRELLAQAIGPERVLAGVAEAIPLADGSVRAVLAADSFHWFDETRAIPEIKRVLGPDGGVAILRTVPVLAAAWSDELGKLMEARRPEHPAFSPRGPAAALEDDLNFGPVEQRTVTSRRTIDRTRVLAYLASMSWVAQLSDRDAFLLETEALLDRHDMQELEHDVLHQIWVAQTLS
jgi:SAM-dependent methyltransferase